MKVFISMIMALLFNSFTGVALGSTIGLSPLESIIGANAIATLFGSFMPSGALCEGVLKEVWTGELVKSLREFMSGSWLNRIPDHSSIANNDVIHLVEVGVDPDVLVNNTTYPIPLQALNDQDIAISLDKFQTKVTPITDDELYAISYDKMGRVKESHANAIHDSKVAKSAHSLCANENTDKTPVLASTGERDATNGRLKFTIKDLARMKSAMDKLKVPVANRILVLCTDHVNDLLETDQSFKEQYNINRNDGTIGRLYGFDIYQESNTPYYTTGGVKKALGSTGSTGEFQCSFAFYVNRTFKATGSTKMYYSSAETDPEYQRNKINFRHHFICMPKKADAGVVMRSGYKANA